MKNSFSQKGDLDKELNLLFNFHTNFTISPVSILLIIIWLPRREIKIYNLNGLFSTFFGELKTIFIFLINDLATFYTE